MAHNRVLIPNPRFLIPIVLSALLLVSAACSQPPAPPQNQKPKEIPWDIVGSWSGRGSKQLESFESQGTLRIKWEAKALNPPSTPATFRLTVHSAISGRPLSVAVDQKGPGAGTAFVGEDPRMFFTVVESKGLDWSFTVEERTN